MTADTQVLFELAELYRIQVSYKAVDGSIRVADPEVLLAVLQALGAPLARLEDAKDALRVARIEAARQVIEPVMVQRDGRTSLETVRLREGVDPRDVRIDLELDHGGNSRLEPRLVLYSGCEVDGTRYGLYRFDLKELASERLPLGYHSLRLAVGEMSWSSLLIAAPSCPEAPRAWGVFIPLHALRSETDWGTGSYSDLASLGELVSALGGSMLGSLPLYPTFLDPPADPSPYRPVSRLAYNELYIDPTALPERSSTEASRLLEDSEFVSQVAHAHLSARVDYEEVSRLKRRILQAMSNQLFSGASPQRHNELRAFAASHPELVDYARFRAGVDSIGRKAARNRAALTDTGDESDFNYHLYCQFVAAAQLSAAGKSILLYADLPIGVHPEGFDPYWSPASFVTTLRGGAPPDAFFTSGQDWGFPPLHPERIRTGGYGYLRAVLSRAFRHAGFMRIDHVMGLQRLYAIPEGFDARHGAYISYRAQELHALVCLEAHRCGTVVVGEDLGTVPDEVRERMAADKMLRSWVFQFESSAKKPLPSPPRDVLASLGTHDLPRFGAYLWGADIDERQATGQLPTKAAKAQRRERDVWRQALLKAVGATELPATAQTETALTGALTDLARSSAALVLIDLEELWGEREPQNRPGTGPEAGNWSRRAAHDMAEICNDTNLSELLSLVDQLRRAAHAGQGGRK